MGDLTHTQSLMTHKTPSGHFQAKAALAGPCDPEGHCLRFFVACVYSSHFDMLASFCELSWHARVQRLRSMGTGIM